MYKVTNLTEKTEYINYLEQEVRAASLRGDASAEELELLVRTASRISLDSKAYLLSTNS